MNPTSIHRGTLLRRVHIGSDDERNLFVRHLGAVVQIKGQADFGRPGEQCPHNIALRGVVSEINRSEESRRHDAIVIEVPEAEWKSLAFVRGECAFDSTVTSTALANLKGVKLWAVRP